MKKILLAAAVGALLMAPGICALAAASTSLQKGMTEIDSHDYTKAILDLEKASNESKSSAAYFLLGYAHYQRGLAGGNPDVANKDDAQQTIKAYKKALAKDPSLKQIAKPYDLYFSLALSYEALGQSNEALDAFHKAISAAPQNALIPLYAARLRFLLNDPQKAAANLALSLHRARQSGQDKDFIKFIENSPLFANMVKNPVLRKILYPEKSDLSDALRDSVRSVPVSRAAPVMSPEDRAVFSSIAVANLAFRNGQLRKAIADYQQALVFNDKADVLGFARMGFVRQQIGICYNKLGLQGRAIIELKQAEKLLPFSPEAHYQLALAYVVMGQYSDSLGELEYTFNTAPSKSDLRQYLILAGAEQDFAPVRDLPSYQRLRARYASAAVVKAVSHDHHHGSKKKSKHKVQAA